MIKVFQMVAHNEDGNQLMFRASISKVLAGLKAGHITYEHVATVNTHDLEHAYERTNSISAVWWDNKDVEKKFEGNGCRSTSVGDILVDMDDIRICAMFGFMPIHERDEIKKYLIAKD